MLECLDDTQLWKIARGGLPAAQLVAIEHHLDRCASCQELVGDLAQARSLGEGFLRPSGQPGEPAGSEEALNRRYILLDPIGRGGMGEVFRALDRLTGGHVALKRMPLRPIESAGSRLPGLSRMGRGLPSLQLHGKRLALANEFRTLASLRHPHIVSVLDYGFDARREPYLTMELLADAQQLLPFAAQAPREVKLHLLAQLLRALSYLHRRGVLHRDLNSRNCAVFPHGWIC